LEFDEEIEAFKMGLENEVYEEPKLRASLSLEWLERIKNTKIN
jgi:hypothetical protein